VWQLCPKPQHLVANEEIFDTVILVRPNRATSGDWNFLNRLVRVQEWSNVTYLAGQFHEAPIRTSATGVGMCVEFVPGDMTCHGIVLNIVQAS
jgi:purine-nucleoside phosphorylase